MDALDKIDDLSKVEVRERLQLNVRALSKGPSWLVTLFPLIFLVLTFIGYLLTNNAFIACLILFMVSYLMIRFERAHYYKLMLKLTALAEGEEDQ